MWELIGDRQDTGVPVKVRFDENGLTSSDTTFIVVAEGYALTWGLIGYTPVGPWVEADLNDETSAYLVAKQLLRRVELTDGTAPVFPEFEAPAPGQAF